MAAFFYVWREHAPAARANPARLVVEQVWIGRTLVYDAAVGVGGPSSADMAIGYVGVVHLFSHIDLERAEVRQGLLAAGMLLEQPPLAALLDINA